MPNVASAAASDRIESRMNPKVGRLAAAGSVRTWPSTSRGWIVAQTVANRIAGTAAQIATYQP